MMDLDETVYALLRPGRKGMDRFEALGVALGFDFFVGIYFGFKNCAAPSIFQAHMLKEFGQAYFCNIGYGFNSGLITNMKISAPSLVVMEESYPHYGDIRQYLLNIRAEIQPKPLLELTYDSKQSHWVYEPLHCDLPKEETYCLS